MESEDQETPQKTKSSTFWGNLRGAQGQSVTPAKVSVSKKELHPRTPKENKNGSGCVAASTNASAFQFFSAAASIINTPPAKRFHRVRNPFEAALTERLHLPLIASPSLFQRPVTTPQLSSTQFEWTIDEVSSLQPANVEPHETQFHDSPDPDYEAKAQSAISSYFKEQQIVPSPVDCPLRTHRIRLSELNGANTPISKPGRRIRDAGTQTELTLPAILPQALEDALRPYFQPQLAGVGYELQRDVHAQRWLPTRTSSDDIKDISLRRKLFDMHGFIVADAEGCMPSVVAASSPSQQQQLTLPSYKAIMGKLSDSSLDKSGGGSCGSLSPISASDWLTNSPHLMRGGCGSVTKRKSRLHSFTEHGELSPIRPLASNGHGQSKSSLRSAANSLRDRYRSAVNSSEQTNFDDSTAGTAANNNDGKFTPDRSSSPLHCHESTTAATTELSTDSSFNIKVSRLIVNSSKRSSKVGKKLCAPEVELFSTCAADDTDELDADEEDDMQVSQLSAQSSNCSLQSSQSDTPRSKRRSASRKNLSQSFNANWLETEDTEDEADDLLNMNSPRIDALWSTAKQAVPVSKPAAVVAAAAVAAILPPHSVNFYRTDSGFNEMSCCSSASYAHSQSSALWQLDELSREATTLKNNANLNLTPLKVAPAEGEGDDDVNMRVCCSTPSKRAQLAAVNLF